MAAARQPRPCETSGAGRSCMTLRPGYRQRGKTVRSPIDCCIAQVAIDHDTLLLHRDRDFETITEIRPLRQMWLAW
jgi:predicted nucleic acid-binding protein